ncbi:MAG: hypothetical protein ACNA8L_12320 [Luteolibacter sp.]|jgi:hypothetical protein
MNTPNVLYTTLLAGLAVATAAAQPPAGGQKMEMRDVATHDVLSNTLRQAQAMNPLSNFKAVEGEAATKVHQPESIIANSDILSFNGLTTLVPKRAILAVPDAHKNRIGKHVDGHKVVTWKEFLFANRGWITTVEVTRAQAEGREALSEATTERFAKATNLIVATYSGGPISVLPPLPPKNDEESAPEGANSN